MGAPGIPVPPEMPPVNIPVAALAKMFLGPVYFFPKIIIPVVNNMKNPIIFFTTIGSAVIKNDKPKKTAIEPAIETGNTSVQSTFFIALGSIVAAPKI